MPLLVLLLGLLGALLVDEGLLGLAQLRALLVSEREGVVRLVPLPERHGVDDDDGVLDDRFGAHQPGVQVHMEVPHSLLSKVAGVVLVEVDAVMVLSSGHSKRGYFAPSPTSRYCFFHAADQPRNTCLIRYRKQLGTCWILILLSNWLYQQVYMTINSSPVKKKHVYSN